MEAKLYGGARIPFAWLGDDFGVLKISPSLQYVANVDGDRTVRIWTLATPSSSGRLVYDSSKLKGRQSYDLLSVTQTKDGFVFVADYSQPIEGEMGRRLLVWDFGSGRMQPLNWGANFAKILVASPERTELARFVSASSKEDEADLWSGGGKLLHSIRVTRRGSIAGYPLMDKQNNMYVFEKQQIGTTDQGHTKTMLINIRFSDDSARTISNEVDFLFPNAQPDGSSCKAMPILLNDGITLATYATGEKPESPCRIQYYNDGKLLKSVNDPVPKGGDETRLAITGDGKGVVTQTVSGEHKGQVGVWDIETGKYSEIASNMPTIRLMFPWVQGKYAPIWSSQNGNDYEAGLLEITRIAGSDK